MWLPADILTLPDVVEYWAARTPAAPMLLDGRRTLTYGQVDARSNALARAVAASGVAPGSHVGFLGPNCVEFWESWFGVMKAGCGLAPLNWRCTVAELAELVADARLRVLIVGAELADTARVVAHRTGVELVVIGGHGDEQDYEAWIAVQPGTPPGVAIPQAATALLSYTSGTTGAPKGVQLPHRAFQYWFQISAMEPTETWRADDLFLAVMPNFHLAGTWVPLPCLYHGGALLIVPAFEPTAVLTAVREHRPTMACLVPTAIAMLLDHPDTAGSDLSSLRKLYYAGSAIAAEVLARAVRTFGAELTQFYGTTETYIITLLRGDQHDPDDPAILASCGTPMPLVDVRLVTPDGREAVGDEPGEVLVRSPMVCSGYWNAPEATREAFVDGWYRTGDVGRRDPAGNLSLVDRLKDMIVTGGENVYSVEVERALTRHPGVAAAAVVGAPDERWGERIVAVVVPRDRGVDAEELREHCRALVAGYKVPKEIHLVDELPTTPSGKVAKNVLRDRLAP